MPARKSSPRLEPVAIDEPSTPLLRAIGHNPRLLPLYREMTRVIVRESELPPRIRWLITMRMAWRSNCSYEFGRRALDAPLEADLALVQLPSDSENLGPQERQIFKCVDQLYSSQRIDDELWSELRNNFSASEIIEIMTVTGLYFMAAVVANSCGVE